LVLSRNRAGFEPLAWCGTEYTTKIHVSGLQPFIDTYLTPRLKTGAISQSRLLDLWRAEFFALPVLDTARKP
jgi:hypothetical protein